MPTLARLAIALATLAAASASPALTINYTFLPGTSEQAQQAIRVAGAQWTSVITTDVTLTLNFESGLRLSSGVLGTTKSMYIDMYYSDLRSRLAQGSTSAADALAVASLPGSANFGRLINLTADNPAGAGSATPYVDHNPATVHMSAANARALGLQFQGNESPGCAAACDARIDISTRYAYDYDPSDGITPGTFDFVGIVRHEIGHALGFVSGVDSLDVAGTLRPAGSFTGVTPLDLFRYSSLSAASHVIDFTADARQKYLSVNGGLTMGPEFAEGEVHGDGAQASHWKDGRSIGAMAPYIQAGVADSRITAADLLALDVIGWTVSAVPEPAPMVLFGAGLAAIAGLRIGRRRGDGVA
ncbi:MAG: PEP-CTERM sorting domain-containing protein [Burkholderiales bacterium]|nr:PEP-CTERM sorting domain-containing protein [Burkholderiales bacterium]